MINKSKIQKIWIIVDADGKLITHSFDESIVEFMNKHVERAKLAGDDWMLLEYRLNENN